MHTTLFFNLFLNLDLLISLEDMYMFHKWIYCSDNV